MCREGPGVHGPTPWAEGCLHLAAWPRGNHRKAARAGRREHPAVTHPPGAQLGRQEGCVL